MGNFSFPENCKLIEGLTPTVGAAAAVAGDYISLKYAQRAWAIIHYQQGDATSITWRIDRDSTVAGALTVVSAQLHKIWSNLDTATSDLFVERTAAINYASGVGVTNKIIIFEIDPAGLGDLAGVPYDCIRAASTTAVAATSWVSILYVVQPRYASAVINQPSMIVD